MGVDIKYISHTFGTKLIHSSYTATCTSPSVKPREKIITMLGTAMPAPADGGLNSYNKN
jgi:hypothetical protein